MRVPNDVDSRMAVVTGASSGIGLEVARLLAADGRPLVLVARSAQKLTLIAQELAVQHRVRVETRVADLSQPDIAGELCRELRADGIRVGILVNNAGVGLHGPFVEQDIDAIHRLIELNVKTLTTLTRVMLPDMIAQGNGRILNVASLVAYQPGGPMEAVYYATKAFVLSFSKGLAAELRGTGVTVTTLCPGPTKTGFDVAAGSNESTMYKRVPLMSAADVARAGYRGMMRGAGIVIPGMFAKLLAVAGELPPRRLALEVNRLLLQ